MSMNTPWAIFLDLDDTLVLTSQLAALRQQRRWSHIYQSFHLTALPPGTARFVQQAALLAPLGVITRTPRPYAERLLAYHHLDLPVVVAFHDVPSNRQKPHPDPIWKAAAAWSRVPERCFYIGDSLDDLLAATNAHALPLGLSWDGSLARSEGLRLALALCTNWNEVLTAIQHRMQTQEVSYGDL